MSTNADAFLKELKHPYKEEILELRKMILSSEKKLTEHIKWNAPSYCINGDDRITFRLQPPKYIQLIFHRGSKVRGDAKDFTFEDPGGLVKWITSDRGLVNFTGMQEIRDRKEDFRTLVKAWIRATAE